MNIPYIRIKQRGEIFFLTKMKVSQLRASTSFHFRDPYDRDNEAKFEEFEDYRRRIERKGIDLKSTAEGIQRRLQIERINDIKRFIETNKSSFFANSILLAADMSEVEGFEDSYLEYEKTDIGHFNLPDDVKFTVIDGQHRLGGLFACARDVVDDFELAVVLLFNISRSTAAKLFSDINGQQKPVNRSLIYDLFEEIDDAEIGELKKLHDICRQFYENEESPLYRQIKMLGIGSGAISQAFFIDYAREALRKAQLFNGPAQEAYNQLFYYFKAFQQVFPNDWPVPSRFVSDSEVEAHSEKVLKQRRSQLVKTNGFGAIMKVFPDVVKASGGKFDKYLELISKLEGNISWISGDGKVQGTGKGFQNELYKKMETILFNQSAS